MTTTSIVDWWTSPISCVATPDHGSRRLVIRFLLEFADDLQHQPAIIARACAVQEQLMARDEIGNRVADVEELVPGVQKGWPTRLARCALASLAPWFGSRNHCVMLPTCEAKSTTGWCGQPSIWLCNMA